MKEKTGINEKTSNGVKKLRVLLADPVRDLSLNGVKLIVLAFAFAQMASAADWFVTTNGTGEGTSWADATNSIQGAIGASSPGETVWVSNGVYDTGGGAGGGMANRVAIDKEITVRSANNDPTNTIIKGTWDPATNGPAAVRCVYMINGSSLIGFTLTNGATIVGQVGGGVYCETTSIIISNCVITGNSADYGGGGAYGGALYNCALTGNSAPGGPGPKGYGGGTRSSKLYDCTLTGNRAKNWGGGAYSVTLTNCTIVHNSAGYGGGAYSATLYNCAVVSNSSTQGAGTYKCNLYSSTLIGNSGVGAYHGKLYNCAVIGNSSHGTRQCAAYNCTIVGNNSYASYKATNYNCIAWSNNIVDYAATWYYSCAPGITGDGCITTDPLFIADGSGYGASHVPGIYRLSNHSPCINTGTNFSWMTDPADARSKDLDGSPRIDNLSGQVDMGCYEHLQRRFTIISIH